VLKTGNTSSVSTITPSQSNKRAKLGFCPRAYQCETNTASVYIKLGVLPKSGSAPAQKLRMEGAVHWNTPQGEECAVHLRN
jgi:hypothetical protein